MCKLEERRSQSGRHRCCTPNLLELPHRLFATACPQIALGKIPTREAAPRLHRISRPFFELIARRLPLRPVNLVQLSEDLRQGRIVRVAFDKIFQVIIARLRRVQLQMGVRHGKERRNHRFARFTFRLFHQRFEQSYRPFWFLIEQLKACMQEAFLPFIAHDFRGRPVEKAPGHGALLLGDKQFGFPQTRRDAKACIVFEAAIRVDCLIGSIEGAQHFRSPECGCGTLWIVALRNFAVQGQRVIIPIQSCKCLSSEKFPARRVSQNRFFQQVERVRRVLRCD